VGDRPQVSGLPTRHVAVVACMDARLDPLRILGFELGEAHVIRNAGGVVTDDVIRSLTISQRVLGTYEIVVLGHTKCAMLRLEDESFRRAIEEETGLRPPWPSESFPDVDQEVRQSMTRARRSPFLPDRAAVRGCVYDIDTGEIREVI
jgi:carbonic anhydrase